MLAYPKEKMKICLLENVHSHAETLFGKSGYSNISASSKPLHGQMFKDQVSDAHVIGIRSRTQLTEEVLGDCKNLLAIGCYCIGTNQVDLSAASTLGIPVFNAPFSNTRSVAELVIGQTIMLTRGIFAKSQAAHRGEWCKTASGSNEVRGKTLGIVGYGNIGIQVSVLAEALGMNVIYYDLIPKLSIGNARSVNSLEELLEQSDVVTLHVPLLEGTKKLITEKELQIMKQGACLINASRGEVVCHSALAESIKSGWIKGAAVDVFPKEPAGNSEKLFSPLQGLEGVILTPHIGGSTIEAQEDIALEVSRRLVNFCDYGISEGAVNFPRIFPGEKGQSHRILHIHKNIPGILQQLNTAISNEKADISAVNLMTFEGIGYAVVDIDQSVSKKMLEDFKMIPGTIRTRILF
jgi:D-3-phosphoglycerate dehydrogenase